MCAKINNLSELSDILFEKDKLDNGVLNFVSRFKIGSLLRSFSALKEQGYPLQVNITNLIFIRLGGMSINGQMKTGATAMDDNTLYRTLYNPRIDWRKMLLIFALQFTRIVMKPSDRCFMPTSRICSDERFAKE